MLANLGCLVFDYVVRQKIGGTHMNFFYVEQLPVIPPQGYSDVDAGFIVPRSVELIYTAWDMAPFVGDMAREADDRLLEALYDRHAQARLTVDFQDSTDTGGPEDYDVPFAPFRWNADGRAVLRAELDAYYARLYGLTRDELRYILDPSDVYGDDFPGETFRVLKDKDMREFGEYRTQRLVLEAWDRLQSGEI